MIAWLGTAPDGASTEESVLGLLSEKVVAETAMLLLCAASIQDQVCGVGERVAEISKLIVGHARSDAVLAGICLEPGLARDHALAHTILGRLGFPDAEIDHLLAESLCSGRDFGPERLPHRLLEQEWMARLWDCVADPSTPDPDLPARSMLGKPLDVLASTRDDIYAFTHAVMYASDLGERQPTLHRTAAEIAADADAALAYSLDSNDFDLTAEVLLTWPMLRLPWSAAAAFAFGLLASVEDDRGFLPGLSFDVKQYESLERDGRATYALASSYHTSYIWGFLCAAALRPGCAPPAVVPGSTSSHGNAEAILSLDTDSGNPIWRGAADRLPGPQRDALATLFLAVLLRRAAKAGDLVRVDRVLRVVLARDLVDGPAPRQAASLLHRSAVLSALKSRSMTIPRIP
jgi:hypothetical protein